MTEYKHIDLDYLYLMADNDLVFAEDMLYKFKETIPLYIKDLSTAIAQKNHTDTRFFAHKLRSSVQIVGAKGLSDMAALIEQTTVSQNNEAITHEITDRLAFEFSQVVEELNIEINNLHQQ
jgi:HPt (histidine-containing phosphotransfer) domain-containing protein